MGLYDNVHAINSTRIPSFVADHSKEIGDYITQANQKHEATTGLMDATEDMLKNAPISSDDQENYANLLADAKTHLSTLSSRPSLADATGEAYRLARQVKDRLTPLVNRTAQEAAWHKELEARVLKETKDGGIDQITKQRAIEASRRLSTPIQLDANGRQVPGTGFIPIDVAPNIDKTAELKKFLDLIPAQEWADASEGDDGMLKTSNRVAYVDKLPNAIRQQFEGFLQINKPWMAMNARDAMLATSEATAGVSNESVLQELNKIPDTPEKALWVSNMNKAMADGKSALEAYKIVTHADALNFLNANDLNQALGGTKHDVETGRTAGPGWQAEADYKAKIEAEKIKKAADTNYDGVAFDSSLGAVGSKYEGITGDTKTAIEGLNAQLEAVKARTPQGGTVDEDSKHEQYNLEQQIKSLSGLSNLKNAAVVNQYKQLNKDKPGGWPGVKEREIKAKEAALNKVFNSYVSNHDNLFNSYVYNHDNPLGSNLADYLRAKEEKAYIAKQLANGNYRREGVPEEDPKNASPERAKWLKGNLSKRLWEGLIDVVTAPSIVVKNSAGKEIKITENAALSNALKNKTEDYISTLKKADAKPLDVKGQTYPLRDEKLENDLKSNLPTLALTDPSNSGKSVELSKEQGTPDNLAKARVVGYNHIFGKVEVILHDGTRVLATPPEGISENLADKIINSSKTSAQDKIIGSMIKNKSVPEYLNALGVHEGFITENPVTHKPFTQLYQKADGSTYNVQYALSPNGNGTYNLSHGNIVNGKFDSKGILTRTPTQPIDGNNLTLGQAMAFMEQRR